MPTGYMLNWSDNTLKPPFLLPEATVDNHTTSLQLTGKRVINWGEFLNENMMHLLEHGFSKTAPNNPTIGQLWLDANNGDLKIFTSQSTWNVIKTVPCNRLHIPWLLPWNKAHPRFPSWGNKKWVGLCGWPKNGYC